MGDQPQIYDEINQVVNLEKKGRGRPKKENVEIKEKKSVGRPKKEAHKFYTNGNKNHDRLIKITELDHAATASYVFEKTNQNFKKINEKEQYYKYCEENKLWKRTTPEEIKLFISHKLKQWFKDDFKFFYQDVDIENLEVVKKFGNASYIRDVFSFFKGYIIDLDFMDKLNNINLWIPTNDGKLFNIKTGDSKPRTKNDLYSETINAKYISQEERRDKVTGDFIEGFCEGLTDCDQLFISLMSNDRELSSYLEILTAIYISGDMSDKSYAIFIGDGDNGKSTFIDILSNMLGPYFHAPSAGVLFNTNNNSSNSHTSHLNNMGTKRLTVFSEPSTKHQIDVGAIKQLTGSDRINIRKLGQEETSSGFINRSHIIITTNTIPKVDKFDEPLKNRTRMIPFNAKFSSEIKEMYVNDNGITYYPKDPEFIESIKNKPDILFTYLIDNSREYFEKNILQIPEKVKLCVDNFVNDSFPYADIFNDTCEITGIKTDMLKLSKLVTTWSNKGTHVSNRTLSEKLKLWGKGKFTIENKVNNTAHLIGVKLIENNNPTPTHEGIVRNRN